MNTPTTGPTKTKSLVQFSAATQGGKVSVMDHVQALNGEIVHAACDSDLDFMFQYHGYWFAIHVDQQGTSSHLRIHAVIGKLPYTYESAFARSNILAVVNAASKALGGRMVIDSKQRILLFDKLTFQGSLSPKVILAETTKVLLRVKPYLLLVTSLQPPTSISTPAPRVYKEQPDIEADGTQTDDAPAASSGSTKRPSAPANKTMKAMLKPRPSPGKKPTITLRTTPKGD